jgi:hypothetical protein
VEVLELRRFLGLGRVVVDERGVTRRGLWTRSLAWDEIIDYRLSAVLRPKMQLHHPLSGIVGAIELVTTPADDPLERDRFRFGIAVLGHTRLVRFGWGFHDAQLAIALILNQLCRPLGRRARAAFERDGAGRFGPLTLADHAIEWQGKPALPRDRVDCIDLFEASSVRLRVMARGKAFPYAWARLDGIPNLVAALDLARALGYPVRGRELLGAVGV